MAERIESIDRFVEQVRERLNRHLGLDILIHCLGAAGAVLILVGLCYVLRGRHVPRFWYPVVLGLALVVALGVWAWLRRSFDQAARQTDRHFQLEDTVRSYDGFARLNRQGGVYDLQAAHTEAALKGVSVTAVKYRWPTRLTLVCAGLIALSLLLTLKADSPQIVAQRQLADQVLAQTDQINAQIKEELEQIKEETKAKDLDKLIDTERLQQTVETLKQTPDLKEAMRQYTQLEKQLNQVLSKLEQRKDEQLYQKMGQALQKQDEAKPLGNRLARQQYKEAAGELQKLKIDKGASSAKRHGQLEKIKSIAKQMAHEAAQANASSRAASLAKHLDRAAHSLGKTLNSASKGAGSQPSRGAQSQSQGSSASGTRSQDASSGGDSSPGSGSQGPGSSGSGSEGGESEGVNEAVDQMADHLKDLDAKCQARSSIQSLCESLAQCQGKLGDGSGQGQGQGQGNGNGSSDDGGGGDGSSDGGRDPGTGHSAKTNSQINNNASSGEQSVLKGIKGQGPSVNTTEAASDGAGSSSGAGRRRIKQYQHQAESFVRREDVSETLKSGVKEYFESIHRIEEGD